jgi:phosphatidylinositol alpha-1,6-mannosyltransferase
MSDVMLMPNRQEENGDVEGFGMVFLEANAARTPVIGGRSGGAIEAIADGVTGFLVNPDDPVEIADILRRLLLDRELREKFGASGERRVWSDFNWESRAEVLREINRNILRRHGKQTACNGKSQPVSETFADEGDHQAAAESKLAE